MNVSIDDPLHLLSQNQKNKIKTSFKQGKSKTEILDHISYSETNDKRYKDFIVIDKEDYKCLSFLEKSVRDDMKEKLNKKLQTQKLERCNQYKNEAWKMYYELLKHPNIKCLPDETIQRAIPNPDEIKKQSDTYRMINKVNPNPLIKNYINACLQN